MSLINRIELSNFLVGTSKTANYRHALFDFEGKSTAVVMGNGGGKTTINNALIGMMSRNTSMIGKTRALMAIPGPGSVYSHIRIEFLMPDVESSRQNALPGTTSMITGETWVFGICGYAGDNGKLYYYYYPGILEDTAVVRGGPKGSGNGKSAFAMLPHGDPNRGDGSLSDALLGFDDDMDPPAMNNEGAGSLTLISNARFREKIKAIPKARIGRPIPRDEWLQAMHEHISPQQVEQHRHFQSAGGGDKSADLYKTSRVPHEAFHQTFFYEHIAPQLTMGSALDLREAAHIGGDENAHGDYFLDEKILDISLSIINTQIQAQNKRAELTKQERAIDLLNTLSRVVEDIDGAIASREEMQQAIESTAALMQYIVIHHPLPGIPAFISSGVEMVDALVQEIVIVPNMKPVFMIRDKGLALLTHQEVKRINEHAQRSNIIGTQPTQLLSLITDIRGATEIKRGKNKKYSGKLYTLNQGLSLLDRASMTFLCGNEDESEELRDSLKNALEKAFDHFETRMDTSPLRGALTHTSRRLNELAVTLSHLEDEKKRDEARKMDIESNLATFRSDQRCFQEMEDSALFSPVELEHPGSCKANLKVEQEALQQEHSHCVGREAMHRAVYEAYSRFKESAPHEAPVDALTRIETDEKRIKETKERLKGQLMAIEGKMAEAQQRMATLQNTIESDKRALDRLESSYRIHRKFQEEHPGEKPEVLLEGLMDQEKALLFDMEDCKKSLHSLKFERIALEKKIKKQTRAFDAIHRKFEAMADFYPSFEEMKAAFPNEEIVGMEDRVRAERAALEGEIKSINQTINRTEKQVAHGVRFKDEVSSLPPREWMDQVQIERDTLYGDQSRLTRRLSALETELGILKDRNVAPGAVYRDAFDRIPDGMPCTSLYLFLTELFVDASLPSQDESPAKAALERYLSLFSSFLFAPVVTTAEDAATLLTVFGGRSGEAVNGAATGHNSSRGGDDDEALPVPVFLAHELKTFIESHPVDQLTVCEETHVISHLFAGRKNEIIECILDPQAIERQRASIREKMASIRDELDRIQARLQAIAPDSAPMTLALRAMEAIASQAAERLETAHEKRAELLETQTNFLERYPESRYPLFREAEQFLKKGGVETWETLRKSHGDLETALQTLRADERALADRAARTEEEHKKAKRLFYDHKNRHDQQKSELLRLIDFYTSGDLDTYRTLSKTLRSNTMELEEFEAEQERDSEAKVRLTQDKEAADERYTEMLTANVPQKQALKEMILFVESDDFAFMKSAEITITRIRERITLINKKLNFRLDEAQRFVDQLATSQSGERERIEEINRHLQETLDKITTLKEKEHALTERQTDLSIASPQYDRMLCHIVSHFMTPNITYKKNPPKAFAFPDAIAAKIHRLYALTGGIGKNGERHAHEDGDIEKSRNSGEGHSPHESTERPGHGNNSNTPREMVSDIDAVNDYLDNAGIGSFADKIKAMTKKIQSYKNRYQETLDQGLADPEIPFKHYEKEHLQETVSRPEFLLEIRKTYMDIFEREKANYERVAQTEETLRTGLAKDLTRLTDKAHDNFIILKKILKSYRSSSGASFDVKVTIAGRDNIRDAIEGLIGAIKTKHELYIKEDQALIEKSPSRLKRDDKAYYGDLRTLISRDCYRQVFLNPEIRFIHPEIRNGVPTIYVNDGSISNGQKSALALLWVVALADFAVQRKLHEDRSRGLKRRNGDTGRVSSFLLIDGLFSQLSDENLISLSMKSLPDTEGNFQIIGFIHSPTYVHQHDFKVFPVLIQGVQHQQIDGSRKIKWVSLEKQNDTQSHLFMKVAVSPKA